MRALELEMPLWQSSRVNGHEKNDNFFFEKRGREQRNLITIDTYLHF